MYNPENARMVSQGPARRPVMKEEISYGNDVWTGRNDGHASDDSATSANCFSQESSVSQESTSEFLTADRLLLAYHLYFSSKL
jgi:hypothetical protein